MVIAYRSQETDDLLHAFINAKADADRALAKVEEYEKLMLEQMEQRKWKTVATAKGDLLFTVTYTSRTTNKIDERGLRKALTAKVFDRYTVKRLDKLKLERAMSDGEVDPVIVAKYVEQVPGKTYLTFRVKDGNDDAGSTTGL